MAKLIYSYLASLDGYIADKSGKFDWAEPDDEVFAFINEQERSIRTYLYGRRMYDIMIGWETDPSLAEQSANMGAFAKTWQAADKIVISSTLDKPSTKRTRVERDFNVVVIRQMKAASPHDIAIGGANLASQAIRAGLVDEYRFFFAPVIVGGGKKLLPEGARQNLKLIDERRFRSGFAYLSYMICG
ncbi:dihydrofolate reductase family protein [Sphingosinicella sp. LHD-64]|uniref:dihydrofolate reductase family protein n=1 Tax=Sphingosinicella sp. LHD-64 TaxID=3072139 RepID=UPI00280FAF93|nr:dihydrofolate reductase family protein [Sphingosinicella sp. LHD-64]MDQ8756221.1 dihydrofolate reductase family protein [Sphingosinicella sp. LHD-64]